MKSRSKYSRQVSFLPCSRCLIRNDRKPSRPGHIGEQGAYRAEMFEEVVSSRLEPVLWPALALRLFTGHAGTLAREMNDLGLRYIPAGPASMAGTKAEVRLLKIHEIVFVQEADRSRTLPGERAGWPRRPVTRGRPTERGGNDPPRAAAWRPTKLHAVFQLAQAPSETGMPTTRACPRMSSSRQPAMPTSGWASRNSSSVASAPGRTTVSGFKSQM